MAATDFVTETWAQALALAIATDVKSLATLVNGNAGNLTALTTTSKTSLVTAINELDAAIDGLSGGGSATDLDDLTDVVITTPATGHVIRYNGSTWVNVLGTDHFATAADITSAITALIGGAPGALNTLDELAAAINDDASYAASIVTALGGKQGLDATLTALAGLTTGANLLPYSTGTDAFTTTTLSAFGRTLIDDADAAAAKTTLLIVSSSADLAAYYTAARA